MTNERNWSTCILPPLITIIDGTVCHRINQSISPLIIQSKEHFFSRLIMFPRRRYVNWARCCSANQGKVFIIISQSVSVLIRLLLLLQTANPEQYDRFRWFDFVQINDRERRQDVNWKPKTADAVSGKCGLRRIVLVLHRGCLILRWCNNKYLISEWTATEIYSGSDGCLLIVIYWYWTVSEVIRVHCAYRVITLWYSDHDGCILVSCYKFARIREADFSVFIRKCV